MEAAEKCYPLPNGASIEEAAIMDVVYKPRNVGWSNKLSLADSVLLAT